MMNKTLFIAVKYCFLLLIILLVQWWVLFLSDFNVPLIIPYTPLRTNGLFLVGFTILILILAEKEILKIEPAINIIQLTLIGTAICLVENTIFQSIRLFTIDSDKLYVFLHGVIGVTLFDAVFSFLIAYQLKTKNTTRLILFIVGFFIICKLLISLFPSLQ